MVNSRQKGARGEREWRDVLKYYGYEARRGQQFSGSNESPDVVCDSLPIHWEVKRVQALNIHDAIQQAVMDAMGLMKIPVVAHRKDDKQWLITMRATDFFASCVPHLFNFGKPLHERKGSMLTTCKNEET